MITWIKEKYHVYRIGRAAKMFLNIDDYLKKKKFNRTDRRAFWRDVINHKGSRKDLLKKLAK